MRTDTDRQIAGDFLTAMGMPESAGLTPPTPATIAGGLDELLSGATQRFGEAALARGYFTEQSYGSDQTSYGADFDAELLAKFGGSVEMTKTDRESLAQGRYWDGTKMVAWAGC